MGIPLRHLLALITAGAVVGILFFYKTQPASVEPPTPIAEFGGVSLRIDYATTADEQQRGLSGRENIPKDYGVLFVFPNDALYGFWMKDMLLPIDIFWLDDKGQVISIVSRVATSSYPHVFYPPVPVRYVLETAAGFAKDHAIATGTPLLLKIPPSVSK